MKTPTISPAEKAASEKKRATKFTSQAEFLAAKNRRFQEVFGEVDWEKARKDGLIR